MTDDGDSDVRAYRVHAMSVAEWREHFGPKDQVSGVVANTRRLFRMAQIGYSDFLGGDDIDRRELGFYNTVVFGWSITKAAQNLRTYHRDEFDAWYASRQEAMRRDELMRWFNELRSTLLKNVPPNILNTPGPADADSPVWQLMDDTPKPTGCTDQFMINVLGGSGWEYRKADGSTAVEAIELPREFVSAYMRGRSYLPESPGTHWGMPIVNPSLENLCGLYLGYLEEFVEDFEEFVASLG